MVKEPQERIADLTGEMLLFRLLGQLLYGELDRSWLQSLIDNDVFSESPYGAENADIARGLEILQKWASENKKGISDESFKRLVADHTRLFVAGTAPAAPWESVYFTQDRLVFQEKTLEVRTWYRRFGLEPEKLHQEPDDHIGLELIFISHLSMFAIRALEDQDDALYSRLMDARREFLEKHPGTWALTWCALVEKISKTDFYQGVAALTRGALSELAATMEVSLAKVANK
jgi:putative dimethyl sulfoxide reductase chaperone